VKQFGFEFRNHNFTVDSYHRIYRLDSDDDV